jgi:hypothetical protein
VIALEKFLGPVFVDGLAKVVDWLSDCTQENFTWMSIFQTKYRLIYHKRLHILQSEHRSSTYLQKTSILRCKFCSRKVWSNFVRNILLQVLAAVVAVTFEVGFKVCLLKHEFCDMRYKIWFYPTIT